MQGRQRDDLPAAADVRRFAGAHFLEAQEGIAPIRDGREIRPHQPVEDVRAQDPQGFRRTMHDDGHGARLADRIDEERDHRDVVQMGVGDEDVIDAQQVFELEVTDPGPRIDQNVVIHEQGRGALTAPPMPPLHPRTRSFIFFSWNSASVATGLDAQAPDNNRLPARQNTTRWRGQTPQISRFAGNPEASCESGPILREELHFHTGDLNNIVIVESMSLGIQERPFTTGKTVPSTWVMKYPWGRRVMTATCVPGLPRVVSDFDSSSVRPAWVPLRIWIIPTALEDTGGGASGAAAAGRPLSVPIDWEKDTSWSAASARRHPRCTSAGTCPARSRRCSAGRAS
jgi:hypothetical protein